VTILHLTTFLQGGAGRAITALAVAQRRRGHHVTVVASRTAPAGYGNYDEYLARLAEAGVDVRLVDSTFTRDYTANLAVVSAVREMFPDRAPLDLIHTHAAIPSLLALALTGSRRDAVPVLQTMHGWGVRKTREQAETDVALMNLVHRVAVPSTQAREHLRSLGVAPGRIEVVPYGVGESGAQMDRRDCTVVDAMVQARRNGRLVVAVVGTVGERKNQRLVVDALATSEAPPDAFCVFVGDGDTASLAAAIRDSNLTERCRIHGYSAAARRIAAAADVFVLPSRSEGQPLSVLEAFADGVLVAVSDISELAELVDDGMTGRLFDVDDPVSLARVLARIASMSEADASAMRGRARQVYSATFTEAAMVDRYERLYRNLPGVRSV
jgi:glycosyltransferase involved in cell wall biosynthesis